MVLYGLEIYIVVDFHATTFITRILSIHKLAERFFFSLFFLPIRTRMPIELSINKQLELLQSYSKSSLLD